jgi:hypothetical protein
MVATRKKSRKNDPSYTKRRSTAPDTQRVFQIQPVTTASNLRLGQTDRILSGYNHRLYRQHGSYRIKVDLHTGTQQLNMKVYALTNTWWVKRAIQMAKQVHDTAMEEERAMTSGARWYDFRIDDNTTAVSPIDNLVTAFHTAPGAVAGTATHPGEYAPSVISDAAGNLKEFRVMGATSATGWNIFSEYDNLGNTARDPDIAIPSGAGYDGADATIDGSNIEALNNRGDLPPYSNQQFPNEVFTLVGELYRGGATSGLQKLSTGFFDAPLGLFWVDYGNTEQHRLQLTVAPGNYKGVHMEAY